MWQLKVICILSLGFSINCFRQNSEDICNQHPRIICRSIRAVLKCHKLSHCITSEWGKTNNHITTLPQKKYLPWSDCHIAMNILNEKFHNLHFNSFKEILHEICSQTSPFSNICQKLVTEYQHKLYYITKSNLKSLSICNNSDFGDEKQEVSSVDSYGFDVECELCKQFAKKFKDLLISSKTEEEFKEILEKVCTATKGFQAECLDIVKNYYDIIYKGLAKQLEEQKVCHYLGFCESSKEVDGVVAEVYIMFHKENLPDISSNNLGENFAGETVVSKTLIQYGALCSVCEYFLQYVRDTISMPVNEKLFKQFLSDGCDDLPKIIQQQCYNFIRSPYLDAFIALFIQEIDPRNICPLINVCPQKSESIAIDGIPLKNYFHYSNTIPPANDGLICPLCIATAEEIQGLITDNILKDTFKDIIYFVCDSVHHNLQNYCVRIIRHFHKQAHDIYTSSPQQICHDLTLCTTNEFDPMGSQIYSLKNNIMGHEKSIKNDNSLGDKKECDACMAFMKRIEKDLKTDDIEKRINEFVRKVCNMFPEITTICLKYEHEVVDAILNFIVNQMTPDLVCKTFDLCPSNFQEYGTWNNGTNSIYCKFCTVSINEFKHNFGNRKNQELLKEDLQSICNIAPNFVKEGCSQNLKLVFEMVLDSFINSPTSQICGTIGLCDVY